MEHEWMQDIRDIFPDWLTSEERVRWPANRNQLTVGEYKTGTVIARAPFGVWLDIGAGHPALLFSHKILVPSGQTMTPEKLPAIGEVIESQITYVGDRCQIVLSQFFGEATKSS